MATTSLWHIEGRLKTARRILHELTPEEMEEAFQQHLTEHTKRKRRNHKGYTVSRNL